MKNLKKIIIILLIVCIIIVIWVLNLKNKVKKKNQEQNIQEYYADVSEDFIEELGIVENHRTFFSVEEMLKRFIEAVEKREKQRVYNLIYEKNILAKEITPENVLEKIEDIYRYASKVIIRNMYCQTNEDNEVYYIHCILKKENQSTERYFALYKDQQNLTYSVGLMDKELYEQKINYTNKEIPKIKIEKNDDNKTLYINPTEEEIIQKYFEDYIENVLYYPEYTYSILDQEYKNKCFPTLEEFKEYVKQKKNVYLTYSSENEKVPSDFENVYEYLEYIEELDKLEISKYKIREVNNQKIYLCVDNKGNYYTFYATAPMNYKVMLDNYTIPTEEFVEEYNKSSEAEKVALSIKRFFMGIDDENYGFSYHVLSESFKNSKYPTKNDFINYAKQNFFEENKIEYISYEKENGLYIYKIKLTDATGKSTDSKEFNIILKLNSGTDFEMSFGEN